ncbi:hypothetical protein K438DRAFT_1804185, partial [Mycena galopus ATCC 62051]
MTVLTDNHVFEQFVSVGLFEIGNILCVRLNKFLSTHVGNLSAYVFSVLDLYSLHGYLA